MIYNRLFAALSLLTYTVLAAYDLTYQTVNDADGNMIHPYDVRPSPYRTGEMWIVGQSNKVAYTGDYGVTWQTPPNEITPSAGWFAVEYSDSDTIHIFGAAGRIQRSTDRGCSWQQLTTGGSLIRAAVYDGNCNMHYVGDTAKYGKYNTCSEPVTFVDSTTDLGTLTNNANFRGIDFMNDSQKGFITGYEGNNGYILSTEDGGDNWVTSYTALGKYEKVLVVSDNVIWVTANSAMLVSTDAGQSWQLSGNVGTYLYDVAAVEIDGGGVRGFIIQSSSSLQKVWVSDDNWGTVSELVVVNSGTLYGIDFFNSNLGFAVRYGASDAEGNVVQIKESSYTVPSDGTPQDLGACTPQPTSSPTFNPTTSTPTTPAPTFSPTTSYQLETFDVTQDGQGFQVQHLAIDSRTAGAIWAAGLILNSGGSNRGAVAYSGNYGVDWQVKIVAPTWYTGPLYSIEFIGSQNIYAFGGAQKVFLSEDGGCTWSFTNLGSTTIQATHYDATNNKIHIAGGSLGNSIYERYDIAGDDTIDWTTDQSSVNLALGDFDGDVLYDIDFLDDGMQGVMVAFESGPRTGVFVTFDGGDNWQIILDDSSDGWSATRGCKYVDTTTIWVTRGNGLSIITNVNNNGNAATVTTVNLADFIYKVNIASNGVAYAVGEDNIFFSSDQWMTWEKVEDATGNIDLTLQSSSVITSIAVFNENLFYAGKTNDLVSQGGEGNIIRSIVGDGDIPYGTSYLNISTCTVVTAAPTPAPTSAPTNAPTAAPTNAPTSAPTNAPTTPAPTAAPTNAPTATPTNAPTDAPTNTPTTPAPTNAPTNAPTGTPTTAPTDPPTSTQTAAPTGTPTDAPTGTPTDATTNAPTGTSTAAAVDSNDDGFDGPTIAGLVTGSVGAAGVVAYIGYQARAFVQARSVKSAETQHDEIQGVL